jgi:hypothetical protein
VRREAFGLEDRPAAGIVYRMGVWMEMLYAIAEVFPSTADPGFWIVCADDTSLEGGFISATFAGSGAEQRAIDYAREKFFEFRKGELFVSAAIVKKSNCPRSGASGQLSLVK